MQKILKYKWLFLAYLVGILGFGAFLIAQSNFRFQRHLVNNLLNRNLLRWENVENFVNDLKFGHSENRARVAVAKIDDRALLKYGRWPWSRQIYRELLTELYSKGARTVVFDAVFSEPEWKKEDLSRNLKLPVPGKELSLEQELGLGSERVEKLSEDLSSVGDRFFSEALQRFPQTVLGYVWLEKEDCLEQQKMGSSASFLDPLLSIQEQAVSVERAPFRLESPSAVPLMSCVVANRSSLAVGARHQGFFNMVPDRDGIFRRYPTFFAWASDFLPPEDQDFLEPRILQKASLFPSLGVQALASYWNVEPTLKITEEPNGDFALHSLIFERDGKVLVNLDTHPDGTLSLPFYGEQQQSYPIRDFSLTEIPTDLQDYIVFIGPTSLGVYDLRPSPVQKDMRGVYLHATFTSRVMEEAATGESLFLRYAGWRESLAALALFCFVLLLTLCFAPLGRALLGALFLVAVQLSLDLYFFKHHHTVFPTVTLLLASFGIISLTLLYRYFTEEREKAFVKGAFEKYVSPKLVKSIIANPKQLNLGGEKRHMSVLFSDLRSFTTMSERMEAAELSKFLNDYLSPMSDIVMKFDGTVDKYIGDAIMAIFGAPLPFADHATKAVDTGLDMLAELERLNSLWQQRGLPRLEMGVGVNTGEMSVGNMGSKRIFSYTVMGDAVNLGSRLEGITKQYKVHFIISESTRKELPGHYACRFLDQVRVKGKEKPVSIYEVLARERTPELGARIEAFERGLQLYFAKNFAEAKRLFDENAESDAPSEIFSQRCELFLKEPPSSDWDGTWTMDTK
jgi:adenylate cyclase